MRAPEKKPSSSCQPPLYCWAKRASRREITNDVQNEVHVQSRSDPCEYGDVAGSPEQDNRVVRPGLSHGEVYRRSTRNGCAARIDPQVTAPLCPGLGDVDGNRRGRRWKETLVDDRKGAAAA